MQCSAAPVVVALDRLAAKLREHEEPPVGPLHTWSGGAARFTCPLGEYGLKFHWWGGDSLLLSANWQEGARAAAFAVELTVSQEGGRLDAVPLQVVSGCWMGSLGSPLPAHIPGCSWGELRAALLAAPDSSLQATVGFCPGGQHVGLDASLRVAGGGEGTFTAAAGKMLDGPLSDVAVAAGGRTFRAHRVVLAAASPVFLRMLDGGMREAREAAVELRDADPAAVELLLRHIYGAAIEVPLPLALPLYALADQYQLSSGLQQQLRLWLLAARLTTEAICTLLPVAWTVCRPVSMRLKADAIEALGKLEGLEQVPPSIAAWPFDVLRGVVYSISIPYWAFATAAVWVEGLPNCSAEAAAAPTGEEAAGNRRGHWPELLAAMRWRYVDAAEYELFRRHPAAPAVPGLFERLADAMHRQCRRLEERRHPGL